MSGERYIHVPDWDEFQHGTKRENPWIKNPVAQLHKTEFRELSFHLRGVLDSIRLAYAASHRQLRDNTATLSRHLGQRVTTRDLERLSDAGFLVLSASSVLAPCDQRLRKRASSKALPPDSPPLSPPGPPSLTPPLAPPRKRAGSAQTTAEQVAALLAEIDKPGWANITADRLEPLLARYDGIDVVHEAAKLRDWETYGAGAGRETKDGIKRLLNWLAKVDKPEPEVEEAPPWLKPGQML